MKNSKESVGGISKKEIQKQIRGIIMKTVGLLGIRIPSKKLKKEVKGSSRSIAEIVVENLAKSSTDKGRSKQLKKENEER